MKIFKFIDDAVTFFIVLFISLGCFSCEPMPQPNDNGAYIMEVFEHPRTLSPEEIQEIMK